MTFPRVNLRIAGLFSVVGVASMRFSSKFWSEWSTSRLWIFHERLKRASLRGLSLVCVFVCFFVWLFVCEHLGVSWSIWVYLGVSGSLWEHLGASGSIWQHLGASASIWQHLVASRSISDYLEVSGISGSTCEFLGTSLST